MDDDPVGAGASSGATLARIPLPAMLECRAASLALAGFYGPPLAMPRMDERTDRRRLWTLSAFGWLVRDKTGAAALSPRGESYRGGFGVLAVDDLAVLTSWTEIAVRAFLAGVATGQINCQKITDNVIAESFDVGVRSVLRARTSLNKRGDTLRRITADTFGVPADTNGVVRGHEWRVLDTNGVVADTFGVPADTNGVVEPEAARNASTDPVDTNGMINLTNGCYSNTVGKHTGLSRFVRIQPPPAPPSLNAKKTGRDSCTNVRENESRGAGVVQPTSRNAGQASQTAEHDTAAKAKCNGAKKKISPMDADAYEIPASWDADATRAVIRRWFDYRRQIGKPYKLRVAVESLLRKCAELDGNPTCRLEDAITESIEHEWQGVFVERQEPRWLDTDEDTGPYTQLTNEELQRWNPEYGFDPPPVLDFDYICKHWRP